MIEKARQWIQRMADRLLKMAQNDPDVSYQDYLMLKRERDKIK